MMSILYFAMLAVFIIVASLDLKTVSSFDIMELCSQKHLRTNNITILSVQASHNGVNNQHYAYPTHYLRHAVRI